MELWHLDLSKLKQIRMKDYIIRFFFGGAISVIAALITQLTNGRIGGIFMAFPAILLASLTIINRKDGQHKAEEDAKGAIIGALAFVLTAIVLSLTLQKLSGALSLLLSLVVWLLCAFGLYALSYRSNWLRVRKQPSPQAANKEQQH
ncbi:DUF3147 family protein [Dictyobacter aurantiacus]|uniref:DUF3147 domain-containing protein n=1 Tax=Dictyobacter aurantiacus TaxID=1936993 RepID=A0A401Z7E2_9CHLR|nr:DUF3147 family protein [Dictyobacter aurantiacus]GCE02759.1 hypothetical protein KDAU_00880 [Dictyobacter aurantiacus]